MAEGFFREYAPKFEVVSAGTEPKSELNPFVVDAMKEIGIDITNQKPKLLSNEMLEDSIKTVNMGCIDQETYWEMILFCAFVPLLMLFRKFRWSWNKMLVISILINIGMLTERFIIVATSQPRKFLPDAFGFYVPSWIEISITIGSFGIFMTLFLIFIKWVPSISLYEVKETLKPLRRDT